MSDSPEFPNSEGGQLPGFRNQRLPSFLETNVWSQEDLTGEAKDSIPHVAHPTPDACGDVNKILERSKPLFKGQANALDWEDTASAWGTATANEPQLLTNKASSLNPSLEAEASLPLDAQAPSSPSVASEGFGSFASFNDELVLKEPLATEFYAFSDTAACNSASASPEGDVSSNVGSDSSLAGLEQIDCFGLDVEAEMQKVFVAMFGSIPEPVDLDPRLLESSTQSLAFKLPPDAQ